MLEPLTAQPPVPAAEPGPLHTDDRRTSELRLTDPKAMRAVAHPVRMALLELFSVNETLTATQASEMLRESPANCAFHLRTLGKYGYITEAGGGKGRERPWTAAHKVISVSSRDQDAQSAVAAKSLARFWNVQVIDRIRRAFEAASWPVGWEHGSHTSTSILYLTPEETTRLSREMTSILTPYDDRQFNPSLRPAGAMPVQVSLFAFPREDLAALRIAADTSEEKETDE
jgi:hypothetical protein